MSGATAAQDVLDILEKREQQGRMSVVDALYGVKRVSQNVIGRLLHITDPRSEAASS